MKAASHPFFKKTVAISDKRYGHFDVVAKVAAIEIEGLDTGLRFEDVKKVFEANSNFSTQSAAAKRINTTLKYLNRQFPASCAFFRNRTVVQSVITLVCHLQQAGLKPEKEPQLKKFIEHFLTELRKQVELGQNATDQDFLEFQRTINANVKSGARKRQATALGRLGKALTSLEDYKRFIEDLYFIFRESIGQRLAGNLPASFVHVNDLRTMLQHDVDHGGAAKAAKKRKQLAGIFKTYSGSSSPDALAPWKFTLVQANILGALKNDLDNLTKSIV